MMRYHKRHYEEVADLIAETYRVIKRAESIGSPMSAEDIVDVVMSQFTSLFARDNNSFLSHRFVNRCYADKR